MPMRSEARRAVLVLVLGALWLGCSGDGDSPTDPAPLVDSVVIESVAPQPGTTLGAGTQVTFRARLRATLVSASAGGVAIVIQDQASRNLSPTVPQPSASVAGGTTTVELADTVTIPASGVTAVHVFFPLFAAGATRSAAVQQVSYPVR